MPPESPQPKARVQPTSQQSATFFAGILIVVGFYCVAAAMWIAYGPVVGLAAVATASFIIAFLMLAGIK